MVNNEQWGGAEAFKNAPRCTECNGKGFVSHSADSELNQLYSFTCSKCNGHKCGFTPEVLEWINPDGSIKRRI